MAISKYRDLEVYCEGFDLAVDLHRRTRRFDVEDAGDLRRQIRRSSKGICANIAEGFGRRESTAEFRRFLRIANGSLQETKVWIEFSQALDFLPATEARRFWKGYDTLGKRLYRLSQTWETYSKGHSSSKGSQSDF